MSTAAESLSRAVSSIDLNAALTATQSQALPSRCTKDQLLGFRPEQLEKEKHAEDMEVADVALDGTSTPPGHCAPNPPPPTPDSFGVSPLSTVAAIGDEPAAIPTDKYSAPLGEEKTKTKTKKKKRTGPKTKKQVTGFEEFYADPPITPDEYEEECDVYDPVRPLHEKIETCIQRYRARRNLDSVRSNILTKYFMLGGIEATARTFTGGLDKETIENSTAEEIRALKAQDFIRAGSKKYYDPTDGEKWVVDFAGIAAGFFSYRVPQQFSTDSESDIKLFSSVIRNFLNYILTHGVCPEYTLDIMAARKICDAAEKELWAITQLRRTMPGDFNVAASTLYGGRYKDYHISAQAWVTEDPINDNFISLNPGLSIAEAERVFKTVIAFTGSDDLFQQVMKMDCEIVKSGIKAYEVVRVDRADIKTLKEYASVPFLDNKGTGMKALGSFTVRSWGGPGIDEEDFTDDEGTGIPPGGVQETETFWLEDEILQLFYVGLKMELLVHELSIGLKFIDAAIGLYCSFHTVLPNEKMVNWKEPVPNERAPPTEDDPDIEERALNAALERDMAIE